MVAVEDVRHEELQSLAGQVFEGWRRLALRMSLQWTPVFIFGPKALDMGIDTSKINLANICTIFAHAVPGLR